MPEMMVTHVGTWVLVPLAIALLEVIIAVTTAKQFVDDEDGVHLNVGGRNRSRIATAIDLPEQ